MTYKKPTSSSLSKICRREVALSDVTMRATSCGCTRLSTTEMATWAALWKEEMSATPGLLPITVLPTTCATALLELL